MCCAFFMCRETTSGSNKAGYPPLRKSLRPCDPVTLHAPLTNASISASLLTSLLSPPTKKRIKMMCCFCCMGQFMGENPTERLAFGGCLQTLALCTVCNFANTLRRFAVYPRFALCRARPVVPRHKLRFWPNKRILFVCLSFACLFLFPTGTQYPAGSLLTSLLKSHYRSR